MRKHEFGSICCSLYIASADSFSSFFCILSPDRISPPEPCIDLPSSRGPTKDSYWLKWAHSSLPLLKLTMIFREPQEGYHAVVYFNWAYSWGRRLGWKDTPFKTSTQSDRSWVRSSLSFTRLDFISFWSRSYSSVLEFTPTAFFIHTWSRLPIGPMTVSRWKFAASCFSFRGCWIVPYSGRALPPYTSFPSRAGLSPFREWTWCWASNSLLPPPRCPRSSCFPFLIFRIGWTFINARCRVAYTSHRVCHARPCTATLESYDFLQRRQL